MVTIEKEKQLRSQLVHRLYCQQITWAQKARQTWLLDGDNNTAYFHNIVNRRRAKK